MHTHNSVPLHSDLSNPWKRWWLPNLMVSLLTWFLLKNDNVIDSADHKYKTHKAKKGPKNIEQICWFLKIHPTTLHDDNISSGYLIQNLLRDTPPSDKLQMNRNLVPPLNPIPHLLQVCSRTSGRQTDIELRRYQFFDSGRGFAVVVTQHCNGLSKTIEEAARLVGRGLT